MGRKILGVVLYILGIIFILATVSNLAETIRNIIILFHSNSAGFDRAYSLGYITFSIALLFLIYYCFKFGNKFLKKS